LPVAARCIIGHESTLPFPASAVTERGGPRPQQHANSLRQSRSSAMPADFDIAIVGAGFGGALMAMIARRLDKSVVLLEKGSHPRSAIGESSTALANLILEELSRRWDLPRIRQLAQWGTWQKTYTTPTGVLT